MNVTKFAENVNRYIGGELNDKQKKGLLGALAGQLNKIIEGAEEADVNELEERVSAIQFARPIFNDLKPELVERLNAFQVTAESRLGSTETVKTEMTETVQVGGAQTEEAEVQVAKKRGKPVDPNSGRQRIIAVLRDSDAPLSPKEINEKLKEQGFEIKYISSHLNYFKAHGQVIHANGKYRLKA